MGIDGKLFRESMGRFPSGVVIATTTDKDGKRWGFTASAFSSLSLDPPLLLVCLDKRADCFSAFTAASKFAVNILQPAHEKVAMRFASKGADKFAGRDFRAGKKLGMPLLSKALVAMECSMRKIYEAGDHIILVGLIESSTVQDGAALAYLGGKFYQMPPKEAKQSKTPTKNPTKKSAKAPAKTTAAKKKSPKKK